MYLCNITRKKVSAFFSLPYQSNTSLMEQDSYVHSLLHVWRKATVLMRVILLHTTVQMGFIRFNVLILISPTVLWHMMTHLESTLVSRICIDSLQGLLMAENYYRIQMSEFMNKSMSVHQPIIYTGLKNLISMVLSIKMTVYFFFDARMKLM